MHTITFVHYLSPAAVKLVDSSYIQGKPAIIYKICTGCMLTREAIILYRPVASLQLKQVCVLRLRCVSGIYNALLGASVQLCRGCKIAGSPQNFFCQHATSWLFRKRRQQLVRSFDGKSGRSRCQLSSFST